MGKTITNTFVAGMNKDIDHALMSNKAYLDAHNYRSITTKGSTSGSLENVKGNHLLEGAGNIDAGQLIIGSCEIRDTIVLFTTNNVTETPDCGRSQIYTLTVDLEDETSTTLTKIYDDNLNAGMDTSDFLNFSTAHMIKALSKYETPNVQKVYWTDTYNNFRYINIANHLTIDGESYTTPGTYMSIDRFGLLPNFQFSKPTLKNIVGGKVLTGMVAYAYQLYIIHGAETAFSEPSALIHVVSDSDFAANTLTYQGDKESKPSGKGFIIEVDNTMNIGYNRLRLVRIHYATLNGLPTISISNEIEINEGGSTIEVTDIGNNLGELTIDEFNIASTELFSCEDIETKDNRLFVTNIKKNEYKVDDWDSRAVRFRASDQTATLLDPDLGPVTITGDLANWDLYSEKHDGICQFNDPSKDGQVDYQYKYQGDGTTLGAEGENIKIDFATETMFLDTSENDTTFHCNPPTDFEDRSYKNYASPWKGDKLSWQRDEIYRLAVVWGNDKGQESEPSWICDLRMPSLHDANFQNGSRHWVTPSSLSFLFAGSNITTTKLYPRIHFKSFPANATYGKVVRMKRTRADRTVVTQALAVPVYSNGYVIPVHRFIQAATTDNLIKLVSPEICITKNITPQASDYLEYVTNYYDAGNAVHTERYLGSYYPSSNLHKLKTNTIVPFTTSVKSNILEAISVEPSAVSQDYIMVGGRKFYNYNAIYNAKGSTGLAVSYTNTSWELKNKYYGVVNYKSDIYGSQYGGHSYENRSNNIYIPCSSIIKRSDIGKYKNVSYGDTFINYFDVATGLADLSRYVSAVEGENQSLVETVYVPLESSINCDLLAGSDAMHITYGDVKATLKQEYMGRHNHSGGDVARDYDQKDPLYLYNTVYSQQLDVKHAIAFKTDKILETVFDCMIRASNVKSNGETTDSWTNFNINEFIEVDSRYGPVNGLFNFNNRLIYFQDKAFGIVAVNDRSLISDKSAAQLVLGTGGVLDRFDYVSTHNGCKDKFTIVSSKSGLYWYDRILKSIYRYSDTLTNLARMKFMQSYLDNSPALIGDYIAIAYSDIINDEILFSFRDKNETNWFTISYNELVDAYVSFYDFMPILYIPYRHRYFTTPSTMNLIYLHDSDIADRCYFYGGYVDSTLKLLFNPEFESTKVFDNLFYISNSRSTTADIFTDTFSSVRCYNDFQNTDFIPLIPKTNIERRERGWTLAIPRNVVNTNVSVNPNIFNDLDDKQTFKERMRDKYLIVDFVYTNDGTYDRFTVSNVGMKYRNSIR